MNREKTIQFIEENGNEIELARLRYLLYEERPSASVIQQLFSGQREDGGFAPFWSPDYSSIDATCYRLAQAEQLGLDASEAAIANGLHFLLDRQQSNGRFAEDPSVADSAPPWAAPNDLAAKLYLTANAGFWLAYFGFADAAQQSASFLQTHLDEKTHKLPSFEQTQWLTCALAWRLNMAAVANHLAATLYANLPQSASDLAWMLTTLLSVNFPTDRKVIVAGSIKLGEMQMEDGRFPNDEGQEVHTTLEAFRVFKKWDADQPDLPDLPDLSRSV